VNNGLSNPWDVTASLYPADATGKDRLRFLLYYAILAPSIRNAQPWLFRVSNTEVALMVDRSRALPVVDPDDRFLIMSCGAALMNLRVAMRHFDLNASVKTFPDLTDPDLLAFVRVAEGSVPTDDVNDLFDAITRRRTVRKTFDSRAVPGEHLKALEMAAAAEGAVFTTVTRKDLRREMASLVTEADRRQRADKSFRRELASWIHPNRSRSHDGLPRSDTRVGDTLSGSIPLAIRTFDNGDGTAAREEQIVSGTPALGVLSTDRDRNGDWLIAGQALERILLKGTALGLSFSFLNQPVEVPRYRTRLADTIDAKGKPQILLRIGYARRTRPSPRRSLAEVLVHPGYNP